MLYPQGASAWQSASCTSIEPRQGVFASACRLLVPAHGTPDALSCQGLAPCELEVSLLSIAQVGHVFSEAEFPSHWLMQSIHTILVKATVSYHLE